MTELSSLGQKHVCSGCTAKFYDLGKTPATCPKCGLAVAVELPIRREASLSTKTHKSVKSNGHTAAKDEDELLGFKGGEIDTIESMDDDDDEEMIISLSELEDRESHEHPETDDDVHEENLMEEMKDYDTILDTPQEEGDEEEARS
jgi:uncharacterized protein (TIGR02300 family)